MALSEIAVQHADDGYSRRGNFGGSLVRGIVLSYASDGTKVCGSRSEDMKMTWCRGLKVVKSCSKV